MELSIYLSKKNELYTLRWCDHVNYITVELDGCATLSINKDAAFDLIDKWYKPHFKEEQ